MSGLINLTVRSSTDFRSLQPDIAQHMVAQARQFTDGLAKFVPVDHRLKDRTECFDETETDGPARLWPYDYNARCRHKLIVCHFLIPFMFQLPLLCGAVMCES